MSFTLRTLAHWLLPRPRPGALLADSEQRTLAAAAEVLLEGIAFELQSGEVTRNVERFLAARGSRRAWRVRVLLTVVELAPAVLLGKRRFSRMSRDERARLMRDKMVDGSHIWGVCGRIRPLVYLGAYASPAARNDVGWVPVPERARFRVRRARTAADVTS